MSLSDGAKTAIDGIPDQAAKLELQSYIDAGGEYAKIKTIDIYFHGGGVLPDGKGGTLPPPTDFVAKAEQQIRDFCKVHTGKGSGEEFAKCFADKPDVYFNEAFVAKPTGKEAIAKFIDGLPGGGMLLEPLHIFVATDETKVASLIKVTLPAEAGGGSMECFQFATLEKETAKFLAVDVFWHAGGILPGVPAPTEFVAKAERSVKAFTAAHKGHASGARLGACYTKEEDGIYWNEGMVGCLDFGGAEAFFKPTTKQGMVDLFDKFPPGISLKVEKVIVASNETQVGALIEVTMPDGTKMKAIDWIVVMK